MKYVLLLFSVLVLSSALWAQCTEMQYFTDTGCSEDANCPPSGFTGCTLTYFTPRCTGTYNLDAWTECSGTSCQHCMVCVHVYDGSENLLAYCKTPECNGGGSEDCCCYTTVSLTANSTYKVWICLSRCPGDVNCGTCGDEQYECQAKACLRYGNAAPCHVCQ